jgi:hypothetical protein
LANDRPIQACPAPANRHSTTSLGGTAASTVPKEIARGRPKKGINTLIRKIGIIAVLALMALAVQRMVRSRPLPVVSAAKKVDAA